MEMIVEAGSLFFSRLCHNFVFLPMGGAVVLGREVRLPCDRPREQKRPREKGDETGEGGRLSFSGHPPLRRCF